ncbi:M15 family metallopeptidase [Nocardioides carbamazepini]|uniref:M15 family metallopeptidase n=1 Tax=Nocardioides carbamazepini TaxID=2854259 RepID=UPI002149E874|nr:M15 family metallopeptidase [Nocardioides carbamazepini]MCR1785230.1 M15 family metallopeptidase [Nocardioides carbamazepini]
MGLVRRALGARPTVGLAAGAALLALTACGSPEKVAEKDDRADPSEAAASTSGAPTAAVADPEHAVEPPGAFDGKQYGDDLLLVAEDTIAPEDLATITGVTVRGKPGVAAYTQLSYGQFSMENKLFNIAAVDPGEFRRFTGPDAAPFQPQWDRVAGGEIAVADRLQKDLPIDGNGYLDVEERKIHVGSWSPGGVDGIDAVVNSKWGEELGLPEDNAVLINTGLSSPQVVRDKIEKAFGATRFSINALDIVAQSGIDPGTYQQAIPVGAFSDAVGVFRYTPIGGGRIAPDPAWVSTHIVTEAVPILGRVTCNKYMMPQLKAALGEIQTSGLGSKIDPGQYAGCYYPRFIAGSTQLSNHSFGLALDLNVPGNQRGTVGQMDRVVVAIFKKWGFAWGGDWAYTDPMHFELARIVNPG